MRGGATTEQIGAAAQERIPIKDIIESNEASGLPTKNIHKLLYSLNGIVHSSEPTRERGEHNHFYDKRTYQFNKDAQDIIDAANDIINAEPSITQTEKLQLELAKNKAEQSITPGSQTPLITAKEMKSTDMFPPLSRRNSPSPPPPSSRTSLSRSPPPPSSRKSSPSPRPSPRP